MIIDAHSHAAGIYAVPETILATAQSFGLERIMLCPGPKNNRQLGAAPQLPVPGTPDGIYMLNRMLRLAYRFFIHDHGDGNKYVHELKQALPTLILQFLWVDPHDRQGVRNLEGDLSRYAASGIKLHQAWNPFAIDGPEFAAVVEIARSKRLPIFIHLYSKQETAKLVRFAKANPNAVFVIAHMLGLDLFGEERRHLEHVYFDTSGSARVRAQDIRTAIDMFGYEHVLFGTDTPYAPIDEQISKIGQLSLSDNVREHIMRLNARRLMGGGGA